MFPLSTPTHSGLWVDYLTLALVAATLAAFRLGLADLCRRATRRTRAIDPTVLSAYGALALVGLSVAVMVAGGRGIPVAQAVFLIVAAVGVVSAGLRARLAWRWLTRAPAADRARAAALAAAVLYSAWFWVGLFQDHVALPVLKDGIAHTAFYLRLLEAGVPTLGRVPIGFTGIFGMQRFDFYPTGTHALVAITSGFWGQWGVISHAGILKACFTLTMVALPWSLVFVVRKLVPRLPWWIGLAVALAAMPGFRFPIEAAHEGGASRLFAHVLLAPVYADVLLGRFASPRRWPIAGLVLGLAFLMHPSTFVMLAALVAYAALWAAVEDTAWRPRALRVVACGLALALGAAVAVAILRWNGGVAAARDQVLPFSWAAWMSRLGHGWEALFQPEYRIGLVKQALIGSGLVLLVLRRRALGLSGRVVTFPLLVALLALVALSAQLVPFPGSRILGGAFYDEVPRVIELLYEAIGLCLAVLAWSLWEWRPARLSRLASSALAVALVIAALASSLASRPWLEGHFRYWDRMFQTARISRLQALGSWIEQNTPRDAILFHEPFDAEIWEAWTGRRGIFMYGECHANNRQTPCEKRKEMVGRAVDGLRVALETPAPESRCLNVIDAFDRPAYVLVTSPISVSRSFLACSDALYVATLDGHAVAAYRAPMGGER